MPGEQYEPALEGFLVTFLFTYLPVVHASMSSTITSTTLLH